VKIWPPGQDIRETIEVGARAMRIKGELRV
jgi:hypothetical protein